MKALLYIFIGGGTGSCFRYLLALWFNQTNSTFPAGTFLANILSCLILGFVTILVLNKITLSDELRLLIMIGFCGGFSTFSTFDNELLGLIKTGRYLSSIIYGLTSIVAGLVALLFGISLGQKFLS